LRQPDASRKWKLEIVRIVTRRIPHDGDSLAPPVPEALARAKPSSDKNINNFTKSAFLLTPRRAEKVRIELLYGMKQVPVCMLMILHLTFAFGTEVGGARESFGKYARTELKEVFDGYAWVLDMLQAPHYHLVGNCGRDVASGFNWRRYDRDRWINRELRGAERLKALRLSAKDFGPESTNAAFGSIMAQLVAGAAGCGIGRIALSPVRSLEPLPSYYGRAVAGRRAIGIMFAALVLRAGGRAAFLLRRGLVLSARCGPGGCGTGSI
jgi:hypothetical protein